MAPVTFEQPSPAEIKAHPRAYALLNQLDGWQSGSVDSEALSAFAAKYGSGGAAKFSGSTTFADIAAAFEKKGSKVGTGTTAAWAAMDNSGKMEPWSIDRRPVSDEDIKIQITYAGVCHSDLHQVKDEWAEGIFPMVPGHEIVGVVVEVGKDVKKFKLGDRAGVGCFVDGCRSCTQCKKDEGNYCSKSVPTYNGKNWRHNDAICYGGYSTNVVVAADYAIRIPTSLPMHATAPLLCAGITTYSPLRFYGLDKKGQKLGVVGMGGLGHMAVRFGKALGLEVTVISTSEKKRETALKLGADRFLVSSDEKAMAEHIETLDGILDTVSAQHSIANELGLLKPDGKLVLLGVPPENLEFHAFSIIGKRRLIGGSMIGGIRETQEMIDFCAEHGVTCEVEVINADYLNTAYQRLRRNDVFFRFSIDVMSSLLDA